MRILVLGGGGYIGSMVSSALSRIYDVTSEDNGSYGLFKYRDVKNLHSRYLHGFDRIIWLCGYSSVSMCRKDPSSAKYQNVTLFEELLKKLKNWEGIFYYASTASVYGKCFGYATEADSLPTPVDIYDETKQLAEEIASHSYLRAVGLRLGTVCGFSYNFRNDIFFNSFFLKAKNKEGLIISNPETKRGILALPDLVDFFVKNISKEIHTPILNLCSFNTTIGEIAYYLGSRYKVNISCVNSDPGNYNFYLSIEHAKITYDWKPCYTLEKVIDNLDRFNNYAKIGGRQ